MEAVEIKSFPIDYKVIDGRTVTGLANVSGIVDLGSDRIWQGAYRKTLRERKDRVRHLWQHDYDAPPIAKIVSLREIKADELPKEVLKMYPEATGGLEVVRRYLETPRGEEVLQGLKEGAINEMSISLNPVKFDFAEEGEGEAKRMVRNIRELALFDTSDVNWGMNQATIAVKDIANIFLTPMEDRFGPMAMKWLIEKWGVKEVETALESAIELLKKAAKPEVGGQPLLTADYWAKRIEIAERMLI